eukprot:gene19191-25037_t
MNVIDSTLLSVIAGSLAGSIGVGVAYPMDAIKTKTQTYASSSSSGRSIGTLAMMKLVLEKEGIPGFYGGVVWVMIGQAFIKSAAFATNTWALNILHDDPTNPTLINLVLSACFAGFLTSFIVNPIERVKILMQADSTKEYESDLDCAIKVLNRDGIDGLVFRGIDATLVREVPGYGLYFVAYSVLKASIIGVTLGSAAPLVCGALAGSFSWIPVYPFDVIKTNMQNTVGSSDASPNMITTALDLANRGGLGIFFDGITPKLIRASINHAVTFYVFDLIMALGK